MSKQKIKDVSRISRKKFLTGFLSLILIGIISLASWNFAAPYKDAFLKYVSTFTTEKWNTYPEKRVDMFNDLEEKHQLEGLQSADVELLLGKPDDTRTDEMIYNIGDNTNGHNKLIITLKNDTVVAYKIETEMYMADVVNKY